MVFTAANPTAGIQAKDLDDLIRTNNAAIQAALDQDHEFDDGAATQSGQHRQVEFLAPISKPTKADDKGWLYTKDASSKVELHWLDEDGDEIQMTDGGALMASYKDRGADSGVDFDQDSFPLSDPIQDAWTDLDLSSIVTDSNATAVLLHVNMEDEAGTSIKFRKNGQGSTHNIGALVCQVANLGIRGDIIVGCDSSQIIEYYLYLPTGLKVDELQVTVKGWFRNGA